jgi:uncharacterized protein (DUF4415 family)
MAKAKKGRGAAKTPKRRRAVGRRRKRAVNVLSLAAPARDAGLRGLKIGDLYRPLKKPVTVRIDADVLAWFKKDGRRYQTRINAALRKVMEGELKAAK